MELESKINLRMSYMHWAKISMLLVLLALSCSTFEQLGRAPTAEQGEEEALAEFMQNYIVENEIEPMIDIIETEDLPGINAPPDAFLIVWSPIRPEKIESRDLEDVMAWLDTSQALQAWLYKDGRLIEQDDAQTAVAEYRQKYIDPAPSFPSIFMWGSYEFGIISRSDQEARVYLSASCGSLCGQGIVFTLQRTSEGQWEIIDQEAIWVS